MASEKKRLFVAVELPQEIKDELASICAFFAKKELFVGRCTRPANLHLTLKFIGAVNKNVVPKINEALQAISFNVCQAKLGSLDVLPSRRMIKILFAHLNCPPLGILAKQIETVLADFVAPETRDFKNHVTIARIKSVQDKEKLLQEVDRFAVPALSFAIEEFVLKESELAPEGPIYKDVQRYVLL